MNQQTATKRTTPPAEPLWTTEGIAGYLSVSRRTVERMRSAGRLPKPDCRAGCRMPRWKAETIRQWMTDEQGRRN
jgi:excisionase family DNA binding protein